MAGPLFGARLFLALRRLCSTRFRSDLRLLTDPVAGVGSPAPVYLSCSRSSIGSSILNSALDGRSSRPAPVCHPASRCGTAETDCGTGVARSRGGRWRCPLDVRRVPRTVLRPCWSYASSPKDTATCLPVFRSRLPAELRMQLQVGPQNSPGSDSKCWNDACSRALERAVESPVWSCRRTFGGSAVSPYYQGTKHKTTKVHYRSRRIPHYSLMHGFSMGPPSGIRPSGGPRQHSE